jgi:hypothetical protein
MKRSTAKSIAIGGLLAALAVVIMSLVALIPVATYICPVLCIALAQVVLNQCGKRIALTWYVAVSILALILSPDKEAALLFCFFGYYPVLRLYLDRLRFSVIYKCMFFNSVVLLLYWALINLLGINQIILEFEGVGVVGVLAVLLLGNITFALLDSLLTKVQRFAVKKNK